MNTLGNLVRQLREQRGWSRQHLGLQAGLCYSTIQNLEIGRYGKPKPETLYKLAVALEQPFATLCLAAGITLPPLGQVIMERRLSRGLNLKELSAAAQVSYVTLWALEHTLRVPQHSTLRRAAQALQLDLRKLWQHCRPPMNPSRPPFGRTLQALREARCLSRQDLARAAGLHYAAVHRLECRVQQPRDTTLVRLAEALQVPVEKLSSPADVAWAHANCLLQIYRVATEVAYAHTDLLTRRLTRVLAEIAQSSPPVRTQAVAAFRLYYGLDTGQPCTYDQVGCHWGVSATRSMQLVALVTRLLRVSRRRRAILDNLPPSPDATRD